MSAPQFGITVKTHISLSMADAETRMADVFARIRMEARPGPAERDALWRELSGVIGHLETIRIWLEAGARDTDERSTSSTDGYRKRREAEARQ
jgi:hypothetical protein